MPDLNFEADLIFDGRSHVLPSGTDFGEWASGFLQTGGLHHITLRGEHATKHGLNMTKLRKGTRVDMEGCELMVRRCSAGIDLTDSSGVTLIRPHLIGDKSDPPGVGILMSRAEESRYRSAAQHYVIRPHVVGSWRLAANINIGSEDSTLLRPRFENDRAPAAIWAAKNRWDVISDFGLTPSNESTATLSNIWAINAQCKSKKAPAAVIIDGFDRVHFSGLSHIASATTGMLIDTKTSGVVGPVIDNLYVRALVVRPKSALDFRGPFGNGIVSCRIWASQLFTGGRYAFRVLDRLNFTNVELQHHENLAEYWNGKDSPDLSDCVFNGTCVFTNRVRRIELP